MTDTTRNNQSPILAGLRGALGAGDARHVAIEEARAQLDDLERWISALEWRTAFSGVRTLRWALGWGALTPGLFMGCRFGLLQLGHDAPFILPVCLSLTSLTTALTVQIWPALRWLVFKSETENNETLRRTLRDRVFNPVRNAFESTANRLHQNNDPSEVDDLLGDLDTLAEAQRSLRIRLIILKLGFADRDRMGRQRTVIAVLTLSLVAATGLGTLAIIGHSTDGPGMTVPEMPIDVGMTMVGLVVAVLIGAYANIAMTATVRRSVVHSLEHALGHVHPNLRDLFPQVMREFARETLEQLIDLMRGMLVRPPGGNGGGGAWSPRGIEEGPRTAPAPDASYADYPGGHTGRRMMERRL